MADSKISALPAATTPLAGTEVLPIVQSGATNKVSVADLTAGRAVSVASLTASGASVISVTNNSNAALRITQLGTGNALLVEDLTNPDASPFVIDANGAVIVGYTATVGTQNYVGAALGNTAYQQHGTSQSTSTTAIFNWGSSTGSPPNLIFNKSISNVVGTRGALTATNTDLGSVTFNGDDGTNFIPAAVILGETDGTPGTNDMPGRLVFSTTADGASTPTERMRISANGNISIAGGTANGVTYLNASKVLTSGTTLTFDGTNFAATGLITGSNATTSFVTDAANGFALFSADPGSYNISRSSTTVSLKSGGPISLNAGSGSAIIFNNGSEAMRLTSTGLGIGTSSPSSKLHVATAGTSNYITNSSDTADGSIQGIVFVGGSLNRAIIRAVNESTNGGSLQFFTYTGGTGTQNMTLTAAGNLGIGTTSPSASAILDAQSTTKGVRMPNMTTTQKNAISSPAAGLMVFDTTLAKLCVYSGVAWQTITSI